MIEQLPIVASDKREQLVDVFVVVMLRKGLRFLVRQSSHCAGDSRCNLVCIASEDCNDLAIWLVIQRPLDCGLRMNCCGIKKWYISMLLLHQKYDFRTAFDDGLRTLCA